MMLSLRWSERSARGPHGNLDGGVTVAKKKAAKKVAKKAPAAKKVAKKAPAKKAAKKKVAKKAKCCCK
jgi:hypothetical protein